MIKVEKGIELTITIDGKDVEALGWLCEMARQRLFVRPIYITDSQNDTMQALLTVLFEAASQ